MPTTLENPIDSPLEPLIFSIRGFRVIFDADLARLYEVTTSVLNQALKRNSERFPSDFAFQLTSEEMDSLLWSQIVTTTEPGFDLRNRSQSVIGSDKTGEIPSKTQGNRSQFVTGSQKHRDPRRAPWVFTEHGALMAANILRSERAAQMSVYVVRAFVKLRQVVLENEAMSRRMAEAELALREHDAALSDLYDKLEPLLGPAPEEDAKRVMGFQRSD